MNKSTAIRRGGMILTIALLGSTAALAFPGHNGGDRHRGHNSEKRIEKMLNAVDASAEQRQAIQSALTAQKPNRDALQQQSRDLHRQIRALDPLAGDYLEQVETIAVQKGQLSAEKFRLHAQMRQQIEMHLTQEQRERLSTLRAERHAKMKEKHQVREERHSQSGSE